LSELIISVSGLRGIVAESLTEEVVQKYAVAFAEELSAGPIVVTRDGRASGPMLSRAIQRALQANGRPIYNGDVAATPTTGVFVRAYRCAGGIQISASHNPAEYNGMKLFGRDGRVISAVAGDQVLRRFQSMTTAMQLDPESELSVQVIDSHAAHGDLVLATVDVSRIKQARFKVVLDSNHAAGSRLGSPLLGELGCEIVALGGIPDGDFDHLPEPIEQNLAAVGQHVTATGAAIGFCQDPDADRLAIIDENGRTIGEEYTLALCVNHVLRRRSGPIVANCSTSRMSQDIAEKFGAPYFCSAVGEANVCDEMIARGAVFGGEGNGGPIDPRVGYVRDSFVGMALLLDAMAARGLTASQLVDELPRYYIHKTKATIGRQQIPALLDRLEHHFHNSIANRMDGLRLDWPNQWLLVRASNTEPIVRLVAEATTLEAAQQLCHEAERVLANVGP